MFQLKLSVAAPSCVESNSPSSLAGPGQCKSVHASTVSSVVGPAGGTDSRSKTERSWGLVQWRQRVHA